MDKKPTIGFLSFDWSFGIKPLQPNGCLYYRGYLPNLELQKFGWDSFVGTPGFNAEHGFGMMLPNDQALHGFDIVSFKLLMLDSLIEQIPLAQKKTGVKVVVDVDDWFDELNETNIAHRLTDPKLNPKNNRDNYKKIIELADAVVVSTPILYDHYSKQRENVFMVRNSIDINLLNRWKGKGDNGGKTPTVGWVGATPWRSNDLEIFRPFLNEFLRENKLKFHHAGNILNAPQIEELAGIDSERLTKSAMQPIFDYPKVFKPLNVGLVPLNPIPFNEAKSFIKGLEYVAAGVPFVASALPEYKFLEETGVGRTASTDDEWIEHLTELLDPNVRKQEREKNRENTKKLHSLDVRGKEWNEVYTKILNL
jgi:glycosyltransferase involved in cell wall biosynthesis